VEIVKRNIVSDQEKMQENSGDFDGQEVERSNAKWRTRATPVAIVHGRDAI
jgi:hypothetical protein